jgi:hypothetical protein
MNEDFEMNRSGQEAEPAGPEELSEAIEEQEAKIEDNLSELQDHIESVDFAETEPGVKQQLLDELAKVKDAVSGITLAGGTSLVALGMMSHLFDKSEATVEMAQQTISAGLATGIFAGALYGLGTLANNIKSEPTKQN